MGVHDPVIPSPWVADKGRNLPATCKSMQMIVPYFGHSFSKAHTKLTKHGGQVLRVLRYPPEAGSEYLCMGKSPQDIPLPTAIGYTETPS